MSAILRSRRLARARRLRILAHRASSANLAGAYPFLAAPALERGVPIGVDMATRSSFGFDPWTAYAGGQLTNPNVLLTGVIGQGKSALAKSLTLRSVAAGRRVYVPGDAKGEWVGVARAVEGQVVALGPGLAARLNPLDVGGAGRPNDAAVRATRLRNLTVVTEICLGRGLFPAEHSVLDVALARVTRGSRRGEPTLIDLQRVLDAAEPDAEAVLPSVGVDIATEGRDVAHALRRLTSGDLAGLFDARSTTKPDPDASMVVLDISRLDAQGDAIAVAMACGAAWLDSALDPHEVQGVKRWIVYDEAWRILGSTPLLRRMQAQWKLSRALGIANLLVLHRLSDLDASGADGSEARALALGLLADCSTRVVYRQETDQIPATVAALGLTTREAALLPTLPRGVGLWSMPGQSYVVRHQLHPAEASLFDTDAAMRDVTAAPDGGLR